jgi:tetratricopeptide (TPR) repeat protein
LLAAIDERRRRPFLSAAGDIDTSMPRILAVLVLLAASANAVAATTDTAATDSRLSELESRLVQTPDSLRLGAAYRQLIIATGRYDRSIKFFERLSRNPNGGANRFINLALAYVDKVPAVGNIRQALLGRDAIIAASHAIEMKPDPFAYLIRGLVNLYYDRAIFHRTDKGVADLEQARRLAAADPHYPTERIYVALGDGYWRWNQPARAREIWGEGLSRYPSSDRLRRRLDADDRAANDLVERTLDPDVRVDTTLHEFFPDLAVYAKVNQP